MKEIALKVCGMKFSENIASLAKLEPQYMGFIFYKKSPRYAAAELDLATLETLPSGIKKVGVFVNATTEEIAGLCKKFGMEVVQLHGHETPDQCLECKKLGYTVIKAFSMDENFNFKVLAPYTEVCDFFLFDTKSPDYGGTGRTFNWEILKRYNNVLPFFLSGGIDGANIQGIRELESMNIHAVDVNSKFEINPGLKDIEKIKSFKAQLKAIVHT